MELVAGSHGLVCRILGDFEVRCDGRPRTPGAPKARQVLALLLVRSGEVVGVPALIEELWDGRPPRSAVSTVQSYVHQLRRRLGDGVIETRPAGYVLHLSPDALDACVFDRAVEEAQTALEQGDARAAARAAGAALDLWRGRMLGGVQPGRHLRGHLVRLEERRTRALELRLQAEMELGRHRELVAELREVVAAHPLNEWFHGLLIEALRRSGRRKEALDAYQDLRRVLRDELGLDPAPELQHLQREVLSGAVPSA
ncbi:AfsR/SARP family transcriptional regulator [Nocardiopsis sp. RSe5-2]|uniref:AfsR/SARP family transcriptional regulator n=1 Tax=Nocardiopsis endophytica TaxID=3018445 RepID=A0ABT4U7S7_9ACTN|nr:AfsR/SARP family transcriptional regulator [Nocardiopsis endophytica]MDA2812986.1 AfsR/SARP family transcriptional regulator [Nocardiopsis endophytica]